MNAQYMIPNLSKLNKIIIGGHVGVFVLTSFFQVLKINPFILGLNYNTLFAGHIYQILSFPFYEPSFISVLFNSLLIWFVGSDLENKWGRALYLKVFLLSHFSMFIVFILTSILFNSGQMLNGMHGFCMVLLFFYAIIYADRPMSFMLLFPMKAKYFCLILLGIQIYLMLFTGQTIVIFAHLMAFPPCYLFLKLKSTGIGGVDIGGMLKKRHKEQMKKKMFIVKDEERNEDNKDDPRFFQ